MTCSSGAGSETCSSRAPAAETGGARPGTPSSSPSRPQFPEAAAPAARYGAALGLLVNGSSYAPWGAVLFGGANSSGVLFNDTWQFNAVSQSWWNVTPLLHCTVTTCPSARHDAMFTYDYLDNYTVLFGGCAIASPGWTQSVPGCGPAAADYLNDTWAYSDPSGSVGVWTRLSPHVSPSARAEAGFTDDRGDHYLLLFGGCGVTCPLSDTWTFSAGQWSPLHPVLHPSARYGMAMGWVDAYGGGNPVYMFGGCTSGLAGCSTVGGAPAAVNDTWEFANGAWTLVVPGCGGPLLPRHCPSPRYLMGETSYQGPGLAVMLQIYGGVGPGGVILGNSTDEAGGGWWELDDISGALQWIEGTAPVGWSSSQGWAGSYPVGPPVPRYDPMLLGNQEDGALLFGGSSATGSSLGDTWWASNTPVFSGLVSPAPTPAPEYGGSMAYYSNVTTAPTGYDVLIGGCGAHCGNVTTWVYNSSAASAPWHALAPAVGPSNSPSPRFNASMIFFNETGGTQSVILFGGMSSDGVLLNDTWTFNGHSWVLLSYLANSSPSPREAAAFAFAESPMPNGSSAVLFGGLGSSGPLSDTWRLSQVSGIFGWKHVSPAGSPSARYGAALTYDAADNESVLFGGCGATCPLADTWTYTSSPSTWTQCTAASCTGSSAPSARWGAAMAYYPTHAEVVLFGGCGSTCPLGDTWLFSSGGWSQLIVTPSPPARYDAAVAYDGAGGALLMTGGAGAGGVPFGGVGWAFQGVHWYTGTGTHAFPRTESPPAAYGVSLAYSPTGNYVLLFGGCQDSGVGPCAAGTHFATTWEFVNGMWKELDFGVGPAPRWDASLIFDTASDYFLLVGGCSVMLPTCTAGSVLTSGVVWKFGNGIWTPLAAPPFSPRGDASMAWDARDNVGILFGGIGCGGICSDSWTYSAGTWTSVRGPLPPGAAGAAITYDVADQYVVLVGGLTGPGTISSTTWTFTVATGWVVLGSTPGPLYDGAMTYDAADGYVVLVGGVTTGSTVLSATWKFLHGTWTPLSTSSSVGGRWGMGLVYDPSAGPNGFSLLFGGAVGPAYSSSVLATVGGSSAGQGDTWEYLGNGVPPGTPAWYEVTLEA